MARLLPFELKTPELLKLLETVDLFSGLTGRQLRLVAGATKERTYAPGKTLVAEGETDGRLHVIVEGVASVHVKGKEIGRLHRGDSFGEIAMLDGGPRSATVRAETDVRAVSIAGFSFRPLIADNPAIAAKLMVALCRRLREARDAPPT